MTQHALEGRHALVTGAGTRGMGQAIAIALARAGADVAAHYLDDREAIAETVAGIEASGRRCIKMKADLRTAPAGRRIIDDAVAALGGLDIFVTSVGATTRKPFLDLTDDDWELVLGVNLTGIFGAYQQACRHMLKAGKGGRLIAVSSVNQELVLINNAHYCASKGGLRQLTKAVALEMADRGITANLIAPGAMLTDFNRHIIRTPEDVAQRARLVPAGRMGAPDDVAEAAVFLAGPGAAYVTGSTITVDGGWSLR
jgi:NAD(P)-dependent dehydrogenase (short-subunit alcohol dehydrogenase family)